MSQKNAQKFLCEICQQLCSRRSDYDRHLLTAKHKTRTILDVKVAGNCVIYDCSLCNYNTMKLCDWNKHIKTKKHLQWATSQNIYVCSTCNKQYNKYTSFWAHCKKCKPFENNIIMSIEENDNVSIDINFVKKILEQNDELRNMLIIQGEQLNKQDEKLNELQTKQSTVINNTTNTMNNKFNLNVFLNEQCKDAMNLMDFVKNIQITNADIENNGQLGFIGGISKIFLDNLKQLSVYERPIHCTDVKRETMYIRSDDKWQKEEDNSKLQKAITEISRKSVAKINQWKTETPEYENMDSPEFMRGIVMSNNSMAGHNRESYADKIIKLLAKETMVDKQIFTITL